MRKTIFAEGEFYHVYNRGTDKREVFSDENDYARFFKSMIEFNTLEPIGSIYEHSFQKRNKKSKEVFQEVPLPIESRTSQEEITDGRLINIIAYCLNPNHYHFILQQVAEKGIEKFMQRLGTGYTKYYNNKHERSGALFQGKFKAIHISSNSYLLHVSAYVNLNNRVHQLGSSTSKSSWNEYIGSSILGVCKKDDVLGQFRKPEEYIDFAEHSLQGTLSRRGLLDDELLLE